MCAWDGGKQQRVCEVVRMPTMKQVYEEKQRVCLPGRREGKGEWERENEASHGYFKVAGAYQPSQLRRKVSLDCADVGGLINDHGTLWLVVEWDEALRRVWCGGVPVVFHFDLKVLTERVKIDTLSLSLVWSNV